MDITIHSDLERKTVRNIRKGSDVGENLDDFLDDLVYEFLGLERENVRKGPDVWKNFCAKF